MDSLSHHRTVTITRVINTCVLLELGGYFVLTDAYFDDHWFFRTNEPIGMKPHQLPPLSAILGGHRAFDHWQPSSMGGYDGHSSTAVYTASPGMTRAARRAGFVQVETLRWGDRRSIGPDLTLTCLQGDRAFGMASNLYLLETSGVSVLVGTEALDQRAMERCAAEHRVDIAVLPVDGATFLGRQLVMNAAGAVAAARALGAGVLVPIHHSERPIPALLRCPTGIEDVRRLVDREPDLELVSAPTGEAVTVRLGQR